MDILKLSIQTVCVCPYNTLSREAGTQLMITMCQVNTYMKLRLILTSMMVKAGGAWREDDFMYQIIMILMITPR